MAAAGLHILTYIWHAALSAITTTVADLLHHSVLRRGALHRAAGRLFLYSPNPLRCWRCTASPWRVGLLQLLALDNCCCLFSVWLQAAEAADEQLSIAESSAAVLMMPSDAADASSAAAAASPGTAQATAASASGAAGATPAAVAGSSANPLFNSLALQLWILRACQQLQGGLRDKPGKHADYYHSCYCLSGLAAAQQLPGTRVVGPPANQLAAMDPVLNVLHTRAAAAQAYFSGAGVGV